jgi:hypothetical protein
MEFLFSSVSVAQKRLDGKTWYYEPKTSSQHTTKWAPLGLQFILISQLFPYNFKNFAYSPTRKLNPKI